MDKEISAASIPAIPGQFRFTPEFRLLVACSWVAPGELEGVQSEKIIRMCNEGIKWDNFITLVDRHRIPALVYTNLRRHAGDLLPEDVREWLWDCSDHARREALRHGTELVRLKKAFDDQGIDVIPLKGQLLSLQLYEDLGMRHSRDLDLLVKPIDFEHAHQLLKAGGYRNFPDFELTVKRKRFLFANYQDVWYVHDTRQLYLDLHWSWYFWTPEQMEELWFSHSQTTELLGCQFNGLDDDALLLFLCDHGARHLWFRLKWLGDVAVMIAGERPRGWDSLIALANRFDLKRPLAQAALLAHWIYEIPLAKPLRELIGQEKSAALLGAKALGEILMDEERHLRLEKRWGNLRTLRYMLRLRPAPPYRLLLSQQLISIMDFKDFPLPDRLFWLYYPLRPLFWLWRRFIKS